MYINIGVLFSIIQTARVWCDILVSAAGIIHNGGRCKSLVAGLQDMAVLTRWWGAVCELMLMCILLQCVIESDKRMSDGKLLSNDKMSLIHLFPSSAFLVARHNVSIQQYNNNLLTS